MSLRPQNQCNACAYTWYPRGKHLSIRCPRCSSQNIEVVRPPERSSSGCGPVVLVAILVLGAIFWATSRSGGGSSSPSSSAEPVVASTADASGAAISKPASEINSASIPQSGPAASETAMQTVPASEVSTAEGAASETSGATSAGAASPSKPTYATSFDCTKATHDDEIAICGDPGLAAMDVELAELYQSDLKTISDPKALARSESGWVMARNMCDGDLDCLRRAYGERIGQFKGSLGSPPLLPAEASPEKP
jgi:uncharacterized protein YecT (DUF1311 family)